jgi:hypothetical protein
MSSSSGMAAAGPMGAAIDDATARPAVVGPGRGRLLDEFAGLVLPVVMPLVRRLPAVVLVLTAIFTVVAGLVLVGAARDDTAIAANSAVATAEVLPGSSYSRTLIRFTTADGKLALPEKGVFYPRGLKPGQIVRVEYDAIHPDLVRVLGRDHTVGYLPIGGIVLALWSTLLPLAFWLRGRQLRRLEDAAEAAEARLAAAEAADAAAEVVEPATAVPTATPQTGQVASPRAADAAPPERPDRSEAS